MSRESSVPEQPRHRPASPESNSSHAQDRNEHKGGVDVWGNVPLTSMSMLSENLTRDDSLCWKPWLSSTSPDI